MIAKIHVNILPNVLTVMRSHFTQMFAPTTLYKKPKDDITYIPTVGAIALGAGYKALGTRCW